MCPIKDSHLVEYLYGILLHTTNKKKSSAETKNSQDTKPSAMVGWHVGLCYSSTKKLFLPCLPCMHLTKIGKPLLFFFSLNNALKARGNFNGKLRVLFWVWKLQQDFSQQKIIPVSTENLTMAGCFILREEGIIFMG